MASNSLKIMVVDDTTTYRMIVRKSAEAIAGVEVVDFAANGRIALDKLSRIAVDVVLLDVEMPEMDGLTTLHHITKQYPQIAVVMVSGASHTNADIVVECLNSGAFDFVTKPLESDIDESKGALIASLRPILSVLLARRGGRLTPAVPLRTPAPVRPPVQDVVDVPPVGAGEKVWQPVVMTGQTSLHPPAGVAKTVVSARVGLAATGRVVERPRPQSSGSPWDKKPALLLIGSSTGGPAALTQVLSGIPAALSIPVLIVQHMPALFTTSLAAQLTRSTGHAVQEAQHDQTVDPGKVFLAPGGRHLSVKRQGTLLRTVLHDGPKVNGCRPAVDVLFMSVMASFAEPILAVILTGMGNDGANGVKGLKRVGRTYCVTQSKESCVVYGMPRVVEEMGLSDASVALDQMGAYIAGLCR
ncbi:MAG: chemotaxis-specific protein-glutamate methyltransferase CheB [Magnetococcales bacterium]|nr:chemotaxis-specific protein-glutamate methyltransferase CheB [Magnetococcales bacterium]